MKTDYAEKYQRDIDYHREYRARPEVKARAKARRKTRNKIASIRLANNARNRNHPGKKAWDRIRRRVTWGTLKRQPCVFCGAPNSHAHHEDYSKALEIVWVCRKHHAAIHSGALEVSKHHIVTVPKYARRIPRD